MARVSGCILTAMTVMLCGMTGCGEQHEISGRQLSSPPVAPIVDGAGDHAGGGDGINGRPPTHSSVDTAGETNSGSRSKDPARNGAWPFRPTSLRLHPLSHALRTDDVVSVIEARIEFFDRFRHTTKGLGVMHFELHAVDGTGSGRRLASWEIDVSDVDANMRHYDDVTRTYLFRLGLDGIADLPASGRLEATATTPTQRMSGSIVIALR